MNRAHILFIEKDPHLAAALGSALRREGFDVSSASHAGEAIAMIRRSAPDMVVASLDAGGPDGMAGHERWWRECGSHTQVIFIAGTEEDAWLKRARAMSPLVIEQRPVDVGALADLIVRQLGAGEWLPGSGGEDRTSILLVEDDPACAAMLRERLCPLGTDPVEIVCAASLSEAGKQLRARRFDAVLLDDELPDGPGEVLLEDAEAHLLTTSVIGLSESNEPMVALRAFRRGCADFITKREAADPDRLRTRLDDSVARQRRRALAAAMDARRVGAMCAKTQEALITDARTDRLTGLPNRAVLDDYLSDLQFRTAQEPTPFAICMVDIDHFKQFNDRYGHSRGDEVLHAVGGALLSCLRETDFIARYGGEEFTLIFEGLSTGSLSAIMARLRAAVIALEFEHDDGINGIVTVSIGGASVRPGSDEQAQDVLRRADQALYLAKDAGRNHAVVADDMPDAITDMAPAKKCA